MRNFWDRVFRIMMNKRGFNIEFWWISIWISKLLLYELSILILFVVREYIVFIVRISYFGICSRFIVYYSILRGIRLKVFLRLIKVKYKIFFFFRCFFCNWRKMKIVLFVFLLGIKLNCILFIFIILRVIFFSIFFIIFR